MQSALDSLREMSSEMLNPNSDKIIILHAPNKVGTVLNVDK